MACLPGWTVGGALARGGMLAHLLLPLSLFDEPTTTKSTLCIGQYPIVSGVAQACPQRTRAFCSMHGFP